MKLRTAIRYQILDFLKPLAIFYSVIILLMATVTIVFGAVSSTENVSFSNMEFNSIVFLCFCGVMTFQDDFKLFIQNGMTRKMIFQSFVCEFLCVAALMALVESVVGVFLQKIFEYHPLFFLLYENEGFLLQFIWLFLAYTATVFLAYLAATIRNRIGKAPFILGLITLGLILFILFPAINTASHGEFFSRLLPVIKFLMGYVGDSFQPLNPALLFIGVILACMAGSYLLTRRAEIK